MIYFFGNVFEGWECERYPTRIVRIFAHVCEANAVRRKNTTKKKNLERLVSAII